MTTVWLALLLLLCFAATTGDNTPEEKTPVSSGTDRQTRRGVTPWWRVG